MAVADPEVNLHDVPVKALQGPTRLLIESMLNPPKVIPNDFGLPRDWRGLASLAGLDSTSVTAASASANPTEKVLALWKEGTLGLLQDYLGQLDRWDIVDDTAEKLEVDAVEYKKSLERASTSAQVFHEDLDKKVLTKDDMIRLDQGLEPQHYHAYLLYAEEDENFAMRIVTEMETKYKLKLCLRDRDLLGGHMFEHEAIMKLISERCDRLIVIFSPNFLKSEANRFFVTFAAALGIDNRRRKVIPVMYERCDLPPDLSYYFFLYYARSGRLWDFWEKLHDSIRSPRPQKNGYAMNRQLSESDANIEKVPASKEIVSLPMKVELPVAENEKWKTGSQTNLSQSSLHESKRCISNPSLNKKSFSVSLESMKGKTLKFFHDFKSASSHKRKGKRELAASEC